MNDYQANVYETSVTVLGPDNRPTHPGDYRVFRAVTSREAARYALALYRRIYGTLRPVVEIRTWHQRDMRDSYNLFTPEELND